MLSHWPANGISPSCDGGHVDTSNENSTGRVSSGV